MLQFNYAITPELLTTIKRITLLVHELNQRQLPSAVQMTLQHEARVVSAFASTSIEGNPLPLTEVKRLLKQAPAHLRQSELEVTNYNRALAWLNDSAESTLTATTLLHLHGLVSAELLPAHQSGQWRKEPVIVNNPRTGETIYLPPNWQDVPHLIDELLTFVQTNSNILDPVLLAGLFHRQFVIIHPFIDGNGRTTRLASNLLLTQLGLNLASLFSFENYYNQNISLYFQQVGVQGDFYALAGTLDHTAWLQYFADGILDELLRVQKTIIQHQATPSTTLKPYHQLILQLIDAKGFVTDRAYAQQTERAKATRTADFNKLIQLGLIERQGVGRATYYRRVA